MKLNIAILSLLILIGCHTKPVAPWKVGVAQMALCDTMTGDHPTNRDELVAGAMKYSVIVNGQDAETAVAMALDSYRLHQWDERSCRGVQWSKVQKGDIAKLLN